MAFPQGGMVAPGYERVRDQFVANFTDDIEVGAGFCVVRDGEVVVDLWGGFQDRAMTRPWQEDTLVNVYSTTKGIASIAFATLVERGLLTYEQPVREIWPELKAAADGLTVGQLLSHQGGLCGVSEPTTVQDLCDWATMRERLEVQTPHWEPGTAAGYHAILWGYLPGELCRRVAGATLGEVLASDVAGALGADFHIGLASAEHGRVADLIGPNHARVQPDWSTMASITLPDLYPIALQNPSVRPWQDACSAAWRSAEIAAANGHATARGIATIYGNVVCSDTDSRVLGDAARGAMTRLEWDREPDLVLGRSLRRGRGVILNTDDQYGPAPGAFGHAGAGGSYGFADPDRRLGFGYAMNQMQPGIEADTRGQRLLRAVYDVVG